jgi:predicted permease
MSTRATLRSLVRSPGFTIAAVLSLAIGIGANTAIFSVAHAILLRPLPYANADRLTILWNRSPGLNIAEDWFSTAQYFDIKNGHTGFETLAIAIGANYNLTSDDREAEKIGAIRASSNLLQMLGARTRLGRLFTADEDQWGKPVTAILSYGLWSRRFGGDEAVVGESITLNSQKYEIVGVLAQGFSLPREVLPTLGVADDGEVFLGLPLRPNAATIRTSEDYNIMGVLKPGVRVETAQTEVDARTARLRRDHSDVYPPNGGLTFSIVPIHEQVAGKIARPLVLLLGSVAFVLLIACANVANLLLSRSLARQKELAVRAAMGASRGQLARLLLSEGLLLALGGGIGGVALAAAAVKWIHVLQPKDLPRLGEIGINFTVLAFTIAISLAAALLFSLAPAIGAGRADPQDALRDSTRGSSGMGALWGRGRPARRLLVAGELALAVTLLIGAGLLIRSFAALQRVPAGFNPNGVLTLEVSLTGSKYRDAPAVAEGYKRLWERLRTIPGVTAAGGVTSLPMSGFFAWGPITVEGRVPQPGEKFINADIRTAAADYFQAMAIPLIRGRLFDAHDTPAPSASPAAPSLPSLPTAPRVILVDALMANQLWPGEDPIGKRIKFGDAASTSPWETVVGIVGRVKQYGLDADARMAFYRPHTQSPARGLFLAIRTTGDMKTLETMVAREMRVFDKDLPLYHLQPMSARVEGSLARQRFLMTLLAGFALLALALAAVGIYGVMAYLVTQGTREIGIRVALGATPGGILGMVLAHGALVAGVGLVGGLAAAFGLAHVMESLLFGVTSRDPLTFAAVGAALAVVALAAVALPALRAARIDPIKALRTE